MLLINRIQSLAIAIANLGKAPQEPPTNAPTKVPKPQVESPPSAPSSNICPELKPEWGDPCSDYDLGLSCDYEYVNTSCEDGKEQCSPTEFHTCEEDGWSVAMVDLGCPGDYPSSFAEPCSPSTETKPEVESPPPAPTSNICPELKPEWGDPCSDYDLGLSCDYEYVNTSCEYGKEQCSPTQFYTCEEDGWSVAMADLGCPGSDLPPDFGRPCKPCPELEPGMNASCTDAGFGAGQKCYYEYRNTSCERGQVNCSPLQTWECTEWGDWMVMMPFMACPRKAPPGFLEECKP